MSKCTSSQSEPPLFNRIRNLRSNTSLEKTPAYRACGHHCALGQPVESGLVPGRNCQIIIGIYIIHFICCGLYMGYDI